MGFHHIRTITGSLKTTLRNGIGFYRGFSLGSGTGPTGVEFRAVRGSEPFLPNGKRSLCFGSQAKVSASRAKVTGQRLSVGGLLGRRTLFIRTADTPNANALKFIPSVPILPEGSTVEFLLAREAHHSPLAVRLFSVDGVRLVMFGLDFITVQKDPKESWQEVTPEVFSLLTEFLSNGQPVMNAGAEASLAMLADIDINDDDSDLVAMIKELIFTRIKPALQDDGGDIEFIDFVNDADEGIILLKLKGACRSCESSSETLKNGIETMLKHYIEEVKDVLQVGDDFQKGDDYKAEGAVIGNGFADAPEPAVQAAVITPRGRL